MTSIRKQWLKVLFFTAILSVIINTAVLSLLMNKYFIGYSKENYQKTVSEIVEYSKNVLNENNMSRLQVKIQLESYLDDPISRIKLYDADGLLIADVVNENSNLPMMGNNMMNHMMYRMRGVVSEEVVSFDIMENGNSIGKLNITKNSSIENSIGTVMYNAALISNSIFSILVVFIAAIFIGIFVSRKMSKDLKNTADMALNIEFGNDAEMNFSNVNEIKTIQRSLLSLNSKLKLKQKSRKKLLDEMVHQTRTPLTILKTHLEGFEDGIINMASDEIKICEDQIENITLIIKNMSGLIDAENEIDLVNSEEFELNQLLNQIIAGLKAQFHKKNIDVAILNNKKLNITTDKYKLSQSIYNILTNAYKFTEAGGKVTVNYGVEQDWLFISIEDNGIGISEEDKKHLFEAYYKGSGSKSSGDGIGLYVVRENLDKINGTVNIISEIGKGSKFIIKISKY